MTDTGGAPAQDTVPDEVGERRARIELDSKPIRHGVYASERLSFGSIGKAAMKVMVANRTREIRPSGMKRGACGNVSMMGAGLRPTGKPMDKPPYPARLRAPHFYPNVVS
jgi:hypothetical protein